MFQKNIKDFNSVSSGRCHNIGAGGVGIEGGILMPKSRIEGGILMPKSRREINFKRLGQWVRRTNRAIGYQSAGNS